MKTLSFILIGALIFLGFVWRAYRSRAPYYKNRPKYRGRIPDELNEATRLLSAEGQLVSWDRQVMGWFGIFEVRGRRFHVSSHRGYIEIYELVSGGERVLRSSDSRKSPKEIYELLTKSVA